MLGRAETGNFDLSMTRKQFIKSQGATCRSWTWSWSFVNAKDKTVIFGAWDKHTKGNKALILDEAWARNYAGRVKPGYKESREHIRLIEEEGYILKTFPQIHSQKLRKDGKSAGRARIKRVGSVLTKKLLKRIGRRWYAVDRVLKQLRHRNSSLLPEELDRKTTYFEGASRTISVNAYERNRRARRACIKHYGAVCIVCGFNFHKKYGDIGVGYIHVHHLVPLAEVKERYRLNPVRDLRPVCANCHAMIHSKEPALAIAQLSRHMKRVIDSNLLNNLQPA
jgi:5-methylcytosine-specific restriction enzyme A